MNKELKLVNIEENKDNVLNFEDKRKLITGGPTGEENWIRNYPKGTVLLAKRKNVPKDHIHLDLYCVLDHKDLSTNLMQKAPDGRSVDLWFRSLEFSRLNDYVETIATVEFGYEDPKASDEEKLENKDDTDGTSNRPV